MELEAQGALVLPTYTGALDFSKCVDEYFFDASGKAVGGGYFGPGFVLVLGVLVSCAVRSWW